MKKYVIGAVVGCLLSIGVTAYGEEVKSLVGRQIEGQFTVNLNGGNLENKAIVIDGTSYLPVREVSEKLNLNVEFDPEKGIALETKGQTTPPDRPDVIFYPPGDSQPVDQPKKTLDELNADIKFFTDRIKIEESGLTLAKKGNNTEAVTRIEKEISDLKSKIADLEKQKAELTK
jgi:hypothetical protein